MIAAAAQARERPLCVALSIADPTQRRDLGIIVTARGHKVVYACNAADGTQAVNARPGVATGPVSGLQIVPPVSQSTGPVVFKWPKPER
jgi:hypothetical protein